MTHPAGILSHQQAEALDWAWVGVWGPAVRDPVLKMGAAAAASDAADFSLSQAVVAIDPPCW